VKPTDATTRKALVELLVIAGQTSEAADVVDAAIALRPDDAEACMELCDVAMRLGAVDRAWRALDAALSAGGTLKEEEERFHRDYALTPLSVAKTAVAPADWKRLFHPKLDPYLSGILACATRAVLRSPRVQATREETGRALGAPLQRTAGEAARVVGMVRRGAQILGVSAPPLYPCKTSAPLDGIPSTSGLLISLEACSALGDAPLSFLIGKHLAAGEPEILAAAVFPTLAELSALLAAALRTLVPVRPGENGPFDTIVRDTVTGPEREQIRALAATAHTKDIHFDVAQWKRLADASAARVGLLLGGSLDAARRAMNASPQVVGGMSPRDQLNELVVLSLGDTYGRLRAALGVAVSG
jgi:hypothetical protein